MKRKIQKLYEFTSPSKSKFSLASMGNLVDDLFCAADESKSIFVFKASNRDEILNLAGHTSFVSSLMFNKDDTDLYSGSKGGLILMWDLYSGKVKMSLQGHSTNVLSMSLCGENTLISGALDGKIKLWDLRQRTPAWTIKAHTSLINCIKVSPNNKIIASGSEDNFVRLWDSCQLKPLKELYTNTQVGINKIEFNPLELTLAYGSKDKTIRIWDLNNFQLLHTTQLDKSPVSYILYDDKGNHIFSATDSSLKIWTIFENESLLVDNLETQWNKLQEFRIGYNEINSVQTFGNKVSYLNLQLNETNYSKKKNFTQRANNVHRMNSDNINNTPEKMIVKNTLVKRNSGLNYPSSNTKVFKDPNKANANEGSLLIKNGINIANTSLSSINSSQNESILKDFFHNNHNSTFNESILKEFIHNKSNFLNTTQQSKIVRRRLDIQDESMIPLESNNDSLISISLLDFEKNIYTESHYSFETLATSKTFINFNKEDEEPIGLEFSKFDKQSSAEDIELQEMNYINNQHNEFTSLLIRRKEKLNVISKFWNEDGLVKTLKSIDHMKDLSVINDLFNNSLISSKVEKLHLTLEQGVFILNNCLALINSKCEPLIKTGMKTIINMIRFFNDKLSTVKSISQSEREPKDLIEKVSKSNKIIDYLTKIYQSKNIENSLKLSKSPEFIELAENVKTDLEFFLQAYKKVKMNTDNENTFEHIY